MYAIVESSGRQYQLKAGRFVDIDLVAAEPGQPLVFDRVLMLVDGKESHVGQPFVSGAKVNGHVLLHGRDRKILVYKQRPKKGTRKKQGHRQGYTRVFVDSIIWNEQVLDEATDAGKGKAKPVTQKAPEKAEQAPAKPVKQTGEREGAKPQAAKTRTAAEGKKKAAPAAGKQAAKPEKASAKSEDKPAKRTTKKKESGDK